MKLSQYEKGFRDAVNCSCTKCKHNRAYWRKVAARQHKGARKIAAIVLKSLQQFPPKERESRIKKISKIEVRRDH